jgi:hypothetical protein
MERRIDAKVSDYFNRFKNDIKDILEGDDINITGKITKSDLLQYIFDYDCLELKKEDFQKRKRVKNIVPQYDRCHAKRANSEQCTRRKKNDINFCGTHVKGTPHGIITNNDTGTQYKKREVWVQEIKGIDYYIDSQYNVYKPEDIISHKVNPRIIANYETTKKGDLIMYSIPALSS